MDDGEPQVDITKLKYVLYDRKSAKTFGERKLFDEMLAGIEAGIYDGLVVSRTDYDKLR